MRNRRRCSNFEIALGDGRTVVGTADGRVLPAEPDVGIMTEQIDELDIEAKVYSSDEDEVGVDYEKANLTDEQRNKVEQRAMDALCIDDN